MTKIDEGFDRAVATYWGKRIVIIAVILGVVFVIYRMCG